MNYKLYLKSDEWKRTRRWALDRAGNKCQLCKSGDKLNVHHNDYSRLGKEEPADIIVLCERCHRKHHDKVNKPKRTLRSKKNTIPFYNEIQALIDKLATAKNDTEIKVILREIDLINKKKVKSI